MIQHNMQHQNINKKHIVVLQGSTIEYGGPNMFLINNVIAWKKLGYKITIICQDRNGKNNSEINSYIQGSIDQNTPLLEQGQARVVVPDINNLIPILACHKIVEFPGMSCKAVHEMTDQQIQTNIVLTQKCLEQVCKHDPPRKILAIYLVFSPFIAIRVSEKLRIPYDIVVPGASLRFTVMIYPHIWKWVLPCFQNVSMIHCRSQLIKMLLLKTFKDYNQIYKLSQKISILGPGVDIKQFTHLESFQQCQPKFLEEIKNSSFGQIKAQVNKTLYNLNYCKHQHIKIQELSILQQWLPYKDQDQTILYVGALMNHMGVGELLAMAPKLIAQRPSLKFIFTGAGPQKHTMLQILDAYQKGDLQHAQELANFQQFISQIDIKEHFIKLTKQIRSRIIFTDVLNCQSIKFLMPLCSILVIPFKMAQQYNISILQGLFYGLTPICNEHSWYQFVLNKIQQQYPELVQVIRVDRQQFYNKLPNTIIRTLQFIKNSKLSKQKYHQKLNKIVVDNFSWQHTAIILAKNKIKQNKTNYLNYVQ